MITPMDAVEWCCYTLDALMARWTVDTIRKARTAQIRLPQ